MDENSSQKSRTIMIVDDELFFRGLLRDILKQEGFPVVAEAVDGSEAIEKYRLHRPAITIMDIFMPEKNGIEATKEIVSIDKNAKVVICSGIGYDDDVEAALSAGARGVILKPFMPKEITETIIKLLGEP